MRDGIHRQNRTVLVVGMGTSTAALTNAVWVLAHQSEPVVPNEIVVLAYESTHNALKQYKHIDGRFLS